VTYSIVARDEATGQIGVAVQTAFFAVGAIVPWARAGVGAVATQSFTEQAYGPRCLDGMARGDSASVALDAACELDPLAPLRQVGAVDARGGSAAVTGDLCIDCCGHVVADGVAAQANMMASTEVWPAMADTFASARSASLARRLLAALRAAQAAGGDARGQMSAAMIVVDAVRRENPWEGRLVDVRVDRHDRPVDALGEVVDAAEAYAAFQRGVDALVSKDAATALAELDAGLALLPGEENLRSPRIGALALAGRLDEAMAETRALLAARPSWAIVLRSFAAKGLIELPPGIDV
jgi:uncharacterized Ntn-hydrolase superfamily protein